MANLIDKDALVAVIERLKADALQKKGQCKRSGLEKIMHQIGVCNKILSFINTLKVKEVDFDREYKEFICCDNGRSMIETAKHFFELGLKASKETHDIWHEVDSANYPNADKDKIYCVTTKGKVILARVIAHPQDDELLQWKCTEFPNHRYDMCEGDMYMEINKAQKGE